MTTTFRDLGVEPEIAAALEAAGAVEPFPIQSMALPLALKGQDLIGQARTGTGKTYAFGVAMLQRLTLPGATKPQGLVVAPTRELALQVAGDIDTAGARIGARVATVFGGRAYEPQIERLRAGVDIVVGTPGRLLDLSNQGYLDLSGVSALVLDEADRMLDLGFLPDVERILKLTPSGRQTMLFSATMPGEIVGLSRNYLRQATHVRAEVGEESRTVPSTVQHVFRTHPMDKPEVVARVLQAKDRGRTMIFCRTKRNVDRLAADLAERGFPAVAVHGDIGQAQREKALRTFRSGKCEILVATDVAARGLDVEDVTHVVNYACPDDEKDYLHRIGRTGRAGREGIAVTFVDWEESARWRVINDALELPFAEPEETYSTSKHLYTELGIPPESTGRTAAAPQKSGGGRAEGERTRKSSARRDVEQESEASNRRTRTRRRTRAGKPAGTTGANSAAPASGTGAASENSADAVASGSADSSQSAGTAGAADSAGASGSTGSQSSPAGGPAKTRRRRRRRGGSGQASS